MRSYMSYVMPGPVTLVASITLLLSLVDKKDEMILSVSPWVSALVGTGYISAVSKKLIPYSSKAMFICSTPSANVFCWPHVIVPKQTLETSRSEEPSFVYSMFFTAE